MMEGNNRNAIECEGAAEKILIERDADAKAKELLAIENLQPARTTKERQNDCHRILPILPAIERSCIFTLPALQFAIQFTGSESRNSGRFRLYSLNLKRLVPVVGLGQKSDPLRRILTNVYGLRNHYRPVRRQKVLVGGWCPFWCSFPQSLFGRCRIIQVDFRTQVTTINQWPHVQAYSARLHSHSWESPEPRTNTIPCREKQMLRNSMWHELCFMTLVSHILLCHITNRRCMSVN